MDSNKVWLTGNEQNYIPIMYVLQMHFTNYFPNFFIHALVIFIFLLHNEVKWGIFYMQTHNFEHYLEHIEMQKVLMTIGLTLVLLPRLSSEPMIISKITAAHKKAI